MHYLAAKAALVFVLAGQSNMAIMQPAFQQTLPRGARVVQCSMSGSLLTMWQGGTPPFGFEPRPYDLAGDCARQVAGARVAGIFWQQGESDTIRAQDADSYRTRFERFARDFRAQLGNPRIPFVYARISLLIKQLRWPYVDTVRAAQDAAVIPDSAVVHTDDLTALTECHDNSVPRCYAVHWDERSRLTLARRMYLAWRQLVSPWKAS